MSPALSAWKKLPYNVALVHTVSDHYTILNKFLSTPAEQIFKKWDVISTSLFHFKSDFVQNRREGFTHFTSPLDHQRITSAYHEWGFVLDVPPQNIIGTYECDIYFSNHIGTDKEFYLDRSFMENDGLLSKYIPGTLGDDYSNRLTKKPGYNDLKTPRQIIDNKWDYHHNEILVMGRPDVQYQSMASKEIKVTGIVRFSDKNLSKGDARVMAKLCEINNIPSTHVGYERKNKR